MSDIRDLINRVARREQEVRSQQFLAPCVRGGRVRTRVDGLVYTFAPQPSNFEGWGIFQPKSDRVAEVIEPADFIQVAQYLESLPSLRLWLASPLQGQTWLAYPANESDMQQRMGVAKPIPVRLVEDGTQFEPIVARWDGCSYWFETGDRRADPMLAESLREPFKQVKPPADVRLKGLTPELRTAYDLAIRQVRGMQQRQDEIRLRDALRLGGAELQQFRDRQDYWHVEWTTRDGDRHTSAISKGDLTVISAGICLSGGDRAFDLQSLVGVVKGSQSMF